MKKWQCQDCGTEYFLTQPFPSKVEKLTIKDLAEFSWAWNHEFFLETNKGNYIWSDPDHHGDNTIKYFSGDLHEFIKDRNIPFVRSKGKYFIEDYCGDKVRIIR